MSFSAHVVAPERRFVAAGWPQRGCLTPRFRRHPFQYSNLANLEKFVASWD